jgi:hypothetical protein
MTQDLSGLAARVRARGQSLSASSRARNASPWETSPTLFPIELVRAFSKGDGSVFVGAGLSMGAGLPSWASLMEPLRERVPDCPPSASLPQIAQFFVNLHQRPALITALRDALRPPHVEPTIVHDAVVSLPTNRIFTTNFDRLLEDALKKSGLPHHTVVEASALAQMSASEAQIIKIHGDLERQESIIITTGDFDTFLVDKAPIVDLLKVEPSN